MKILFVLFLAALQLQGMSQKLFASFEDMGTSARATALGGAFTSLSNDISALYYNPSGLVHLRRKEFSATYGLLHTGLGDKSSLSNSYVAYGQPLDETFGVFGFSWQQTSLANLYGERTLTLGYGRKLSRRLAGGFNVKQLHREFTAPEGQTSDLAKVETEKSDPAFAGGSSKSNIAADVGFLFCPYKKISYGLMLQNLNEPNLAISDSNSDPVPMTLRSGITYKENNLMFMGELYTKKSLSSGRDIRGIFAAEKWWLGAGFTKADLAARGSLAVGSRSFSQMGIGFSYRVNGVQMDYGFLIPLGGITFGESKGSHRITLTLRFGKTLPEPEYELRARAAEISAQKAEGEIQQLKKESEKMNQEQEKIETQSKESQFEMDQIHNALREETRAEELKERLAAAMDGYWRRKSQEATVDERISILSKIVKDFSDFKVDLSQVKEELAVAKSDRAKAEMDLAMAWDYYEQMVARGASVPERIQILSTITLKFSRTGADLTNVIEELKALREK